MFPTFISILDIQSWWEVPSIAHFCSLFRTAFNLLDFDIEDLEEALLTDGTEETSWLQELIVRLLTGCLPNNEISTFNYQMFLRRLFREKCKEHDRYNPFNTDVDFQLLPLRTKVDILHALCDFRLDAEDVLEQLKNLEADSLRVEPLGYDNNDSAYWYFYGTRLYREDFKSKTNKKGKSVWQVVCFTEEDWFQLAKKFKKSQSKSERQLYRTLTENFLPELPRLFHEKERLARKRLLDNQPRRTSSRLGIKRQQELKAEQAEKTKIAKDKENEADEETKKKKESERRRQEAYERRTRLREQNYEDEDKTSESSKSRYEMAGNKKRDKKSKAKQGRSSNFPSGNKDQGSSVGGSSSRHIDRGDIDNSSKQKSTAGVVNATTAVGRQTNNSLASATGQIVIQPILNPHRKKLKTSQVFRQTDEDLQTGMHKILDSVKNHEDAWPFIEPVEEEHAPNYYSIVRKPMDLQRMEERLDSGYYKTFSRFRGDFQLIVDNCRLYNGADNEYTEMVGNLVTIFERATERYLDEITSSDEEITVEYRNSGTGDESTSPKRRKMNVTSAQRPTLAVVGDKRSRVSSVISETTDSTDLSEEVRSEKKPLKVKTGAEEKAHKKNSKAEAKQTKKKPPKNRDRVNKKQSTIDRSPVRSRSPSRNRSLSSPSRDDWSSSPPPSWPSSSPGSDDLSKMTGAKGLHPNEEKAKQRDKRKEITKDDRDKKNSKHKGPASPPKQKDKHNKLRETIEKLKAKSQLLKKLKGKECEDSDGDKTKENRKFYEDKSVVRKRHDSHKSKSKHKVRETNVTSERRVPEFEDENSAPESVQSENKKCATKRGNSKSSGNKNNAAIEALTLATEQTLKDINKWLDDTPRLSEFSSASNSPSHYIGAEEFDGIGSKIEQDYRKRLERPPPRKDSVTGKDIKRRTFHRDPAKFLKKREVQRTIDRLQPGKSKGNLLSNLQGSNKADEPFPLGPLAKMKDTKNSLIVKADEGAPKLSLGSVLDNFGKHKFVDDVERDEERNEKDGPPVVDEPCTGGASADADTGKGAEVETSRGPEPERKGDEGAQNETKLSGSNRATPNLSAWFKAFGAPKVPPNQKKLETKTETKETDEQRQKEEPRKAAAPDVSPNPDSPVAALPPPPQNHPVPRQRKMSTGSTVSERSSFSQDMDSPRIGIDERLGAYPAPYPSPLHRSPSSGARSPATASPRPDVSPKSAYPTVNGQIRVGFYQDTVSSKSSPDKSCSPREGLQSPSYPQYSEQHVYVPMSAENSGYSYGNPSYYYSNAAASTTTTTTVPTYNPEHNASPSYYDTNKPLTDQYQAKVNPPGYSLSTGDPPNFQNVHSPNYHAVNSPASPNLAQLSSPVALSQSQQQQQIVLQQQQPQPQAPPPPSQQHVTPFDSYRQPPRIPDKQQQQQSAMFPVKKRVYNESDTSLDQQHLYDRNYEMSAMSDRQADVGGATANPQQHEGRGNAPPQQTHQYVHQNIPQPRSQPQNPNNVANSFATTATNLYGYNSDSEYALNVAPERPLDLNSRPETANKSKYTNMGYTGSAADLGFNRNPVQYAYSRPVAAAAAAIANKTTADLQPSTIVQQGIPQNVQGNEMMMRYGMDPQKQPLQPDMSHVARSGYAAPLPALNMDQSLGLRENLANAGHMMDRFPTDNVYYSEKGLSTSHVYGTNKPITTNSSALSMFGQPNVSMSSYGHDMQPVQSSMYSQLQQQQQPQSQSQPQHHHNQQQLQQQEKKSKRRKGGKAGGAAAGPANTTAGAGPSPSGQGFQSYTGLKGAPSAAEPGAISLKTASVVPGSAFNFGPAPAGLGLSPGLYGDKDAYPNFLEDYRAAPNYYMAAAAAAAAHRAPPDTGDKQQTRTVHQAGVPAAAGYPFIGPPQPRPPGYPLGGSFMSPHQASSLMDAGSPLYQQYLQAGVLHQGLLGPPGAYPPGYHPALSMRQPFDSMTRPSWL